MSDQDRGKLPGRAASALDKDAKAAGAPLTPSGAFLVRRALGDAGRRLDEAGPEAAAEDAALTLAAPLARAAVELASAAWRPSSILDVAVAAHQCVVHPERGDAPPAKILELKVAVYDDEEALPDVRAGDLATCDVSGAERTISRGGAMTHPRMIRVASRGGTAKRPRTIRAAAAASPSDKFGAGTVRSERGRGVRLAPRVSARRR